jgi:threonine synthase
MGIEYISTRNKELRVDAAYAIKQGLSPDGGLFVPREIPRFAANELAP